MTKRAVCYVRLSSYRGEADASTSPRVQEDRTRAYCLARGWEVAEVVRDLDVSGSARGARLDRPGIRRIRELYRTGAADVVVALRLDRLARNTRDLLTLIEDAEEHGAAVATVEGAIDTGSSSGRLILTILGAVAEMEAEQIRERTAAGRAEAQRQGRWVGGVPQYGTRAVDNPDGGGKVLEVNPDEARVLRRMMRLYLDGHGAPAIARRLNADGVPSKKGGQWKLNVVLKVLRQHAEESIVLTGPERYALADELDARARKRETTAPDGGKSLLSAVLKCSTCGSGLYYVEKAGGGARPVYRCSTRVGDPPRLHARVIAEDAEALVVGVFLEDWSEYRPAVRVIPTAQWDIDLAAARDAVEALERDLAASKGTARREVLERLEAAEDAVQQLLDNPPPRVPIFKRGTVTVGEEWESAGQLERRQLLKKYLGTVLCTPARGDDGLRSTAERLTIPRIDDADADTQPTMKEKIPTDG